MSTLARIAFIAAMLAATYADVHNARAAAEGAGLGAMPIEGDLISNKETGPAPRIGGETGLIQAQENGPWVVVATVDEPGKELKRHAYKQDDVVLRFGSQESCGDFLKSGDDDFEDATDDLLADRAEGTTVTVLCTQDWHQ